MKKLLTGLVIGLVIGIGVMALAISPSLALVPPLLIFVLASSPAFSWAGSSAGMLVVATMAMFAGLATAAILETFDRVSWLAWVAGRYLFGVMVTHQSSRALESNCETGGDSYNKLHQSGFSLKPANDEPVVQHYQHHLLEKSDQRPLMQKDNTEEKSEYSEPNFFTRCPF